MRTGALLALFMRWWLVVALGALGLAACAPEIVRRPTQLTPVPQQSNGTIEILEDASISVGPGYRRVIRRGSLWARIGRSVEGEVSSTSPTAIPGTTR